MTSEALSLQENSMETYRENNHSSIIKNVICFFSRQKYVAGAVILLFFICIGIFLYFFVQRIYVVKTEKFKQVQNEQLEQGKSENQVKATQIDCKKIVSAIRENERDNYIACSNVLFFVKIPSVVKQWNLDEFQSTEITSIAKVGSFLFVGSRWGSTYSDRPESVENIQKNMNYGGGLSRINLETGEIERFNVSTGMRTSSVNVLIADGTFVWIGTDADLYRYDTALEKMESFTESINPLYGEVEESVENILVTPTAVFVHTGRAVMRYDKKEKLWEKYDELIFRKHPFYDLGDQKAQLIYTNGVVMLWLPTEEQDGTRTFELWYANDMLHMQWHMMDKFPKYLKSEFLPIMVEGIYPVANVIGYSEDGSMIVQVEMLGDRVLYYVNPLTNTFGSARKKYTQEYVALDPEKHYRFVIEHYVQK